MLSKEYEPMYRVVINYDTSSVSVLVVRGIIVESSTRISKYMFDSILGTTIETRIHKATCIAQQKCDMLNEELEKMKQACIDAESIS